MTTPQSNLPPPTPQEQEPFIPPFYLLIVALAGFLVAFGVAATQPTFTVVGWGGLGLAVLSLVAWVLMAPDQARAVLTGRTVRYGGTSLLVTVLFLGALVAIYSVVRNQNWRLDLTQRNDFSLSAEARAAITTLGADPNITPVRILAFYGQAQAGRRDQDTLLLEDYKTTSNGKIDYQFVDPERDLAQVNLFGVTRAGEIVVARVNADGSLDSETAETVNFFAQDELTNAILRVSAAGDFRMYVLNVQDGLSTEDMQVLTDDMTNLFDWTVEDISFFDLLGSSPRVNLNADGIDGTVLIIPGGSTALTDDEVTFLRDYLNSGGDLIVMAGPSANADRTSLVTGEAFSSLLWDDFGLRFRDDVVLDSTLAAGEPTLPIAVTFDPDQYISANFQSNLSGVFYQLPKSIEVSETPRTNVTVSSIIQSNADTSYSKTLQAVLDGDLTQAETDPRGPFVLGATAENSQTGARVALYSSPSVFQDVAGQGLVNRLVARLSVVWATNFDNFFSAINIQSGFRPEDTGVAATFADLRNINLLTVFVIPFGVLAIGLLVWWNNREQRTTQPQKKGN